MKLIKYCFIALIIFAVFYPASGQGPVKFVPRKYSRQDSIYEERLFQKSSSFFNSNIDSATYFIKKEIAFSQKAGYLRGDIRSHVVFATLMGRIGNLPQSIKIILEQIPRAREIGFWIAVAQCYYVLGLDYQQMGNHKASLRNFLMCKVVTDRNRLEKFAFFSKINLAREYLNIKMADSAQYYLDMANSLAKKTSYKDYDEIILGVKGGIEIIRGNYRQGINDCKKSLLKNSNNLNLASITNISLATAYQQLKRNDSCIYYAKVAYKQAVFVKNLNLAIAAANLLKDAYYNLNDFKIAFNYQQIMLEARDSLYNGEKAVEIQNELFSEAQERRKIEDAKTETQSKKRQYIIIAVLTIILITSLFLFYTNSQSKKSNKDLQLRNNQIDNQHNVLKQAFSDLKSTQAQLIQSEKMASLGELTAGIAHEIQNPLNFVNNFSEVNAELLEEMMEEIDKGGFVNVKLLSADIYENEKKINLHGKRADAIVKGMLEHSRTSTGDLQLTNLNDLADEFLRLSYHGLRANDKNFNAEILTHFDKTIPQINIVQQDIGRVLLNLFNNAFYAVNEKKKISGADYKPEVTVITSSKSNEIEIRVKDNGNGIPDAIKDKIMQPFFTTKPSGKGTGLGLSLSYDIVVKGHGGSIEVESKEMEFTAITVKLPI